mgnify:FL=1|tara:strand:+ start:237 stop:944 length:708 start_codon:yes stop_codon:yes gene_type:complete
MTWRNDAEEYAKQESPKEACGLLTVINGEEKFWPCKNIAEGQHEFFALDPEDWADCEDQGGEILGVIHSHPKGSANASEADEASCEHLGFPYFIYSVEHKNWNQIKPTGWKPPSLIGRTWVWGKQDCWSLITDYFLEKKQINLKYWERPKSIKSFCKNPYFEKVLTGSGFVEVNKDKLQKDDILLVEGAYKKLNHVALYYGDQLILHHSVKKLSCRELYDLKYIQATKKVYRYAA